MTGFLKTLVKPDFDDNPKRSKIIHAANLLQVGEFQLIQLAFKAWYNKELPENKINLIFSEYMLTDIVPIWVTYYADDIIKLDKAKVLDGYNKKYHIYDNEFGEFISDEKKRKNRGIFYTIIIGIIFVGSHFMSTSYVDEPDGLYPPYIEKKIIYPELYKEKNNK